MKTFKEFIEENETSDYKKPEHLVSPAIDDKGEIIDKIYKYVRNEYDNVEITFKPSIKDKH